MNRPKINTTHSLKRMSDEFLMRIKRQGRAEAEIVKTLLDVGNPGRCEEFFDHRASDCPHFFVVCKKESNVSWNETYEWMMVGIFPVELVGLGDGEFCVTQDTGPRPVIAMDGNKSDSHSEGEVIYLADTTGKVVRLLREYEYPKIMSSQIRLGRSRDGVLFPMLALFALRLEAIHGKPYSVEMAAEEVFDLEFASRPENLATLEMPPEIMVATTPICNEALIKSKYGNIWLMLFMGREGNMASIWIYNEDFTRMAPVSFYKTPLRPFPITFPSFQTRRHVMDNLDGIDSENPVLLVEFAVLGKTHNKRPMVLHAILGEVMIPKIDFSPTAGKPCVFIEIRADEDADGERAHRVALKTFARAYEQGNRNFMVLVWDTGEEIPMDRLLREAMERGYLDDAVESDAGRRLDGYLDKWPKPADQGKPIVGRAIKAGRCILLHASPGVGKSLFMQAVSTVAYQRKSLDNACFQYTWNGSRQCRILNIQNEMDADEFAVRQKSFDAYLNVSDTRIEYHTPEGSLTDTDEQIAVLKKLEVLDPEGQYQWLVVIDSIKTVMPDAEMGATFTKKVSPFIRALKNKGCCVVVLHHSNLQGKSSGGTNVNVTNNCKIHLEQTLAQNGHKQVIVTVEKSRDLTGNENASATWDWTVDENKVISEFNSIYDDAGEPVVQASESPVGTGPDPFPSATEKDSQNGGPRLPNTWDELNALPKEEQSKALFELWNKHGNKKEVATTLGVSLPSLEKKMKSLNVNKQTKTDYLRSKMTGNC